MQNPKNQEEYKGPMPFRFRRPNRKKRMINKVTYYLIIFDAVVQRILKSANDAEHS